jgi:toxin CcdB
MSRQFDVHGNLHAETDADPPYLVNLQSDHLDTLRTRIVAPLWEVLTSEPALPTHVALHFAGERFRLALNEMAFVRGSSLGPAVGNIAAERDRIVRALDLLFTGV